MNKKLKIIENVIFMSGFVLSIYTLVSTYILNSDLPPGVCPVNSNKDLLYISIGLLLVSIIFPYITKHLISEKN